MNYISAEEFLKQSEDVQEVFINWWKPTCGDIFTTKRIYDEIDVVVYEIDNDFYGMNTNFMCDAVTFVNESLEPFPLLQMHQLIKFIEDKTNGKTDIEHIEHDKILITIVKSVHNEYFKQVIFKEEYNCDLLYGLWEVACRLVEGEILL